MKPVTPSTLLDTCLGALQLPGQLVQRAERREETHSLQRASLAGARVLLVEDNPINQEVARDLLGGAGVVLVTADNGQQALDRLAQEDFDIVLMDCQMPVMDGYAATRALRRQPRWRDLPIIAMTANAMEADRQRCFAAGMNDHVAKPIEPAALWAALGRWIRPRAGLGAAAAKAGVPSGRTGEDAALLPLTRKPDVPPPSVPLPTVAGLDTTLGLQRALGKPVLYVELLRRFAEGQAPVLAELQQALAANNLGVAERLAHTLRSVAANIGAPAVSERAQALEHALRFRHGNEAIVHVLAELRAALVPLLTGLQAWVVESVVEAEPAPAVPEPGGELAAEAVAQAVQRLRHLLEQDDPAATEFFQHNGKTLGAALGDVFKTVEMHTLNFDFELALEAMAAVPGSESLAAPLS